MQTLVIEDVQHDGVLVLRPVGEIDIYTAPLLRDSLTSAVAPRDGDGAARVVVDLARVPFIDSAGLGVLIAGFKAARASGGDLVLCGVPPVTARLLQITGIHKVVTVYLDEQAAVSGMQQHS